MQGVFSAQMLAELTRAVKELPPPSPYLSGAFSAFGFPVRASNAFPFVSPCHKCAGSGEGGEEATYCRNCKGGGRIQHEGAMIAGPSNMTVLVSYFPKLFEPSFPFALPVRPLPNRNANSGQDIAPQNGGGM